MEPQTGTRTWQWVVTVVVIIILVIIGIFVFGKKGEAPTTDDSNATTTVDNATGANRITMTDQYPGNVVYISSAQLENPGYIAIAKDDAGKPGKIIGSTRLGAGINPGRVNLSEPMVDGGTYYAVLYSDSPTFDATKNTAVKDTNGNVVLRVFKATTSVGAGIKG